MKRADLIFGIISIILANITMSLAAQDTRGLEVVARPLIGENAAIGRQLAVIIAIDKYREWSPLQNPVKDARELRSILAKNYFIDEFDELYDADATKAAIFRLLDRLATTSKSEDSILIYYAGHGYRDETSSTSFWAPVDAGKDQFEQKNWIPASQLRGYIANMKARHVLLISDSCFSGDILDTPRGAGPAIDSEYFRNAYARVSRQVLTSGASETVSDNSSFSRQLILALEGNTESVIDPLALFSQIRLGVTGSTPLFGSLQDSGNQQGGGFLLFRRGAGGGATDVAPAIFPPSTNYAELSFPNYGIELSLLAQGQVATKVENGFLTRATYRVVCGAPISLAFASPYASRLDLPKEESTFSSGERRILDVASGRFSLPWIPAGTRVTIGASKTIDVKNEATSGFRSPPLPVGQYVVHVDALPNYSFRADIRADAISEPEGFRQVMYQKLSADRTGIESELSAKGGRDTAGWISLGTGLVGATGAGLTYALGQQALSLYQSAADSTTATNRWIAVQNYGYLFYASAIIGGAGIGLAPILWAGGPDRNALQRSLDALDAEIQWLKK